MPKEIISQYENDDLKIFQGRVLTLLGDLDNKLDRILFFCGPEEDIEYNRDSMEDPTSGEWDDG